MSQNSNLECFLSLTTPRVPSQTLPKTRIWDLNKDWQPLDKDRLEYFSLGDLWNCYDEWSAYGVGAPIVNCGETVVQYYTPYLSAIQIYTDKAVSPRDTREDTDGEFESKSWTSESEDEKLSRSSSNSDRTWDMEDLVNGLNTRCPAKSQFGELYFEYFEVEPPFTRVPLKDKIDALACKFPHLKSLNSFDLSPASWMAVAWYPIYHIPFSRNSKELYASFLTYHTLSSSFQDDVSSSSGYMNDDLSGTGARKKEVDCGNEHGSIISLQPFGMASYRMQRRVWLNPESSDGGRLSFLVRAADSWLKQLRVRHPDFNFFMSHADLDGSGLFSSHCM